MPQFYRHYQVDMEIVLFKIVFFSLYFLDFPILKNQPYNCKIIYKISLKHSLRFLQKSIKPFKSMFAHPFWSTFHIARKKINSRTCANRYFGIILCDIFVNPFFLLWASQTDASKSRYHSVSELDYSKSGWFQTGSESRNNGSGKTS